MRLRLDDKPPRVCRYSTNRPATRYDCFRTYSREHSLLLVKELVDRLQGDARALVFCMSKDETEDIATHLDAPGYWSGHPDGLERALERFERVLVSTSVLAE